MSATQHIPFALPGFAIDTVDDHYPTLTVTAHATSPAATCPDCGTASTRIHSYYSRSPRDLPISEWAIRLILQVRRFRCVDASCTKTTFAERLGQFVLPHAQRTVQLTQLLRELGFALGGEPGARIAHHIRVSTSADTLLRIVRCTPMAAGPTPRVLGVDDWAIRKGQRYGTILLDLERHCPVDLLPDREAESLAAWLTAHPGVTVISRDRFQNFIQGAPQALQVADRWHLLKNLGEALHKLLEGCAADLRATARYLHQQSTAAEAQEQPQPDTVPPSSTAQALPPNYRETVFHEVKALAKQGYSTRAIAHQLNLHRETVARYMCLDHYTRRVLPQNVSTTAPYWDYLQRRWQEGCQCVKQLWRESQAQGYGASYMSVWRAMSPLQAGTPRRPKGPTSAIPALSARKAMWLLVKAPEQLNQEEQDQLQALCQCCATASQVYPLAQRFVEMGRECRADELDGWLHDAKASSLKYLCTFVKGLKRDYLAVQATNWSNGQTEGHVNRLKCLKRQMYGRANFDLLRLRVLPPT